MPHYMPTTLHTNPTKKSWFSVTVSMRGYDPDREDQILAALPVRDRRYFDGSDFGFDDNIRNLFFYVGRKATAQRLTKALRALLKKQKVRGSVSMKHYGESGAVRNNRDSIYARTNSDAVELTVVLYSSAGFSDMTVTASSEQEAVSMALAKYQRMIPQAPTPQVFGVYRSKVWASHQINGGRKADVPKYTTHVPGKPSMYTRDELEFMFGADPNWASEWSKNMIDSGEARNNPNRSPLRLDAGDYYIVDPSYVLGDVLNEMLPQIFKQRNAKVYKHGKYTFLIVSDFGGDGLYDGVIHSTRRQKIQVGVDSGMVGVIPVALVKEIGLPRTRHLKPYPKITFDRPATVKIHKSRGTGLPKGATAAFEVSDGDKKVEVHFDEV